MADTGDQHPRRRPRDEPERSLTPAFRQPDPEPEPDPAANPPEPDPEPNPERWGPLRTRVEQILSGAGSRGSVPDDPAARTPKSWDTTGDDAPRVKPSAAEVTGLMVGVLGLVVVVVAGAVNLRSGGRQELRRPTPTQSRNVATPLARILNRRFDMSILGPDIVDGLAAATAASEYVGDGRLIRPKTIDTGVPANLSEDS